MSTRTLPHIVGHQTGDGGVESDFDKKVEVRPSDLLTLVSKTVQYLRDSCVPRRNNVKETDGRSSAGHPCRRDGSENCCSWQRKRICNHGKWWSAYAAIAVEKWWSAYAAVTMEKRWSTNAPVSLEEWWSANASVALEVS